MLMLRLQRTGRKHAPSFRLVVTDKRHATKSGKFLEVLGAYDARHRQPTLKAERIKYWLSVGAQPSGTVHNLLVDKKIIAGPKINVLPKRKPVAAEVEEKKEEVKTETKTEEKVEEKKEEVPVEAT